MLVSYQTQLMTLADQWGIQLKDAFMRAGIPTSTYYRSMTGPRAMTYETANRVAQAIAELAAKAA